MSLTPETLVARINEKLIGLDKTLGLQIVAASSERVEAELHIDDRHRQVHGVVHGGVYAAIVETVGSVGAFVAQGDDRCAIVGMENHTSFVRAVRDGTLRAVAVPLNCGRRTQLWEVHIQDDQGKLAASGRLRTLCLQEGSVLAGAGAASLGLFSREG